MNITEGTPAESGVPSVPISRKGEQKSFTHCYKNVMEDMKI